MAARSLAVILAGSILCCTTATDQQQPRSRGCGQKPPFLSQPGSAELVNIEVDGLSRQYLVQLPPDYEPQTPAPLVLSFHGWTLTSCFNRDWFAIPDAAGYIMVYPQGVSDCDPGTDYCYSSWNGGGCDAQSGPAGFTCSNWTTDPWACPNSCAARGFCNVDAVRNCNWCTCVDDVSFVRQLLDSLLLELCVDTGRIYATGESNGGLLTWDLAAQLNDRLVAVVPWISNPQV